MRRALCLALLGSAISLLCAATAYADNTDALARLVAIRINTTSSDDYGVFHGFIITGDDIGGPKTYKWGGSQCPAVDVTDAFLAELGRGLQNPRIRIEVRWKPGQGATPCLVAFTSVLRSETGVLP